MGLSEKLFIFSEKLSRMRSFIKSKIFIFVGKHILKHPDFIIAPKKSAIEINSKFKRSDVINKIISTKTNKTYYLEIGVRNPEDNFNKIKANVKYSVDPGIECKTNKADFKFTSDDFFRHLDKGEILSREIKFDVIFIDGLHLAEQVEKDINNSLRFLKDDGFIVIDDCNPPTEWHSRESHNFNFTPAQGYWNGTTWKAFLKKRFDKNLYSCCVDTNWGIGIISKNNKIGESISNTNIYFEYQELDKNRKQYLNLITFDDFVKLLQ